VVAPLRALGWGLALLAVSWMALWLFGLNLLTIGLLLLCGASSSCSQAIATASRYHG
jgi:hypothetical protein